MSTPPVRSAMTQPGARSRPRAVLSANAPRGLTRRTSGSGIGLTGHANPVSGAPKAQRTSKTTHKLVLLPSAPQTKPLPIEEEEDEQMHGYETDRGVRDIKSAGERMSKDQRKKAGYKRLTAFCVAEAFKMNLLATFLKREHNVHPRVYDEATYVMYHLPLLPGYGPNANLRSSAAPTPHAPDALPAISEAEDNNDLISMPATPATVPIPNNDSFFSSPSILDPTTDALSPPIPETPAINHHDSDDEDLPSKFAEVVFFTYGVVVFLGLEEGQERAILEDVSNAGVMRRPLTEDRWEIEECHFAYEPYIAYPRVYNDFFTFKHHSSLLSLSVSHALAQSTLLARYETLTNTTLSSPATTSIPQQLATTGSLHLSRTEALKITGRLFKLRRDVNLVSNVLDVPELFWAEGQASLRGLYDAVREYMEIGQRVGVLNEKLAVAEDLLGAIHDHLNNNAMERITWIIIWLIVVACLVEFGEVIARLAFHAAKTSRREMETASTLLASMPREQALQILERIMRSE
ncbi:hypothetical protein EUX98_g3525 [Antrodiella citrinella]|uniref:DUF155 domain-containing protein n=1 Tax=Antrodiella citrinella TaxID=2447956 RepID=A0A4S4MZ42_9APHY|nr:hypothetical protein EUX98_g3525 [Antrodiella citrinella]